MNILSKKNALSANCVTRLFPMGYFSTRPTPASYGATNVTGVEDIKNM